MLKRAVLNDAKNVFDVFSKATSKLCNFGIQQWDSIYPNIDVIREDIKKGQMYILCLNGKIAACGVINDEEEGYENGDWQFGTNYRVIHRFCVSPSFQSMGIGKRMLSLLHDEILKQGFSSVRIDVFPKNKVAVNIYRNFGYIEVGEVEYRKGIFKLMEKKL